MAEQEHARHHPKPVVHRLILDQVVHRTLSSPLPIMGLVRLNHAMGRLMRGALAACLRRAAYPEQMAREYRRHGGVASRESGSVGGRVVSSAREACAGPRTATYAIGSAFTRRRRLPARMH